MAESSLTPPEQFIARRIKNKLSAAGHHLVDARAAAIALTPEMHRACGFREQLAVLEGRLAELRAIVHGLPGAGET